MSDVLYAYVITVLVVGTGLTGLAISGAGVFVLYLGGQIIAEGAEWGVAALAVVVGLGMVVFGTAMVRSFAEDFGDE